MSCTVIMMSWLQICETKLIVCFKHNQLCLQFSVSDQSLAKVSIYQEKSLYSENKRISFGEEKQPDSDSTSNLVKEWILQRSREEPKGTAVRRRNGCPGWLRLSFQGTNQNMFAVTLINLDAANDFQHDEQAMNLFVTT